MLAACSSFQSYFAALSKLPPESYQPFVVHKNGLGTEDIHITGNTVF